MAHEVHLSLPHHPRRDAPHDSPPDVLITLAANHPQPSIGRLAVQELNVRG